MPKTFVVPFKKIGLPDDPSSVLASWENSYFNVSDCVNPIIFPKE